MTGLKLNSFVDFRMAGRKIRSVWMGDSHLMDHHHLPGYFFDGLLPNPDLHKYYRGLYGSQKSGARMDKPLKDKIYDLSHKYKGEATLFVIQAGSNNFRGNDREKDPNVTVDKLLADYKELKDHFLKQKSQALIVTSVIPDKKPELAPHFAKINTSLRLMFNNAPEDKDCRLHYVDFVGKHLPQKEDGTFYDKALYQDALHLNEAGAKLLRRNWSTN
jgi:GDSL-like Lipase/Acylhydrolase.